MRKRIVWSALLAFLLLAVGFRAPAGAQDPTPPDPRIGMVDAFWLPEEAADLGIGWERLLFYWREIQPTGPDDWNTLHVREEWLREAQAQGRDVVGVLKNTPPWATEGTSEAGVPRGLYLPLDDPDNLWAGFVRKVARYYSARGVHHWIVWNEPEIKPDVYGHEFAGDMDDYVRLLEVAYRVMKEEDPQAVIHLAGLTWWHDPGYLARFLERLTADPAAASYNYYFDVISLHIYFRTETVAEIVGEVNRIQQEAGLQKAIWINETNASPNLDPRWPVTRPAFQVDLDQQAWFITQALALGFASGADRIGVYKLVDIGLPPGGESFGVLHPDQSPRPAYFALQAAIDRLGGFTGVGLTREPSHYEVTFNRPGEAVRVLWARTRTAVELTVPALGDDATAVIYSATGQRLADISAEEGVYTLSLEGARCETAPCDIGGPPLFLVESGRQAPDLRPVPTLAPTPLLTPTSAPTATPLPPTATPTPLPLPTRTATVTVTPAPTQATATPAALAAIPPTATLPAETEMPESSEDGNIGVLLIIVAAALGVLLAGVVWRQRNRST